MEEDLLFSSMFLADVFEVVGGAEVVLLAVRIWEKLIGTASLSG